MKKINFDIMFKIIILLGFSAFFIKIILNDEITSYVHPRIIPFVYLGILFMIVISIYLSRQILSISRKKFKLQNNIIYIIPLIMIIFFEITSADTSAKTDNSNKTLSDTSSSSHIQSAGVSNIPESSIGQSSGNSNSFVTTADNNKPTYSDYYFYGGKTQNNGENTSLCMENNIIKVNVQNFVSSLDELINNCSEYDGRKIEIDGFVYKNATLNLNENQFIIARYMMVCCAADMQIAGLRCEYDLQSQPSYDLDTWVKIKGTIKTDIYEGVSDPLVIIDTIEIDSNPDTSYVYPY